MKKILSILILFGFVCCPSFARTLFYEDYSFYAQNVTDIGVSDVVRSQQIQAVFPSPLNPKIPMILKGHAYYKEIDKKPYIEIKFDELSLDAEKYIPAKILVTAVNGQKIKDGRLPKITMYKSGLKNVKGYAHEFLTYPLNRYKYNPVIGKPTKNAFIVLLEPFYAVGSGVLYILSPFTAPFYTKETTSDILKGSVFEFEFLEEVPLREDL